MKWPWLRKPRDERGAALILAIVFMVVIGAIGGGVVASISSGLHDGAALAQARNREYAADAAVETSIARVRLLGAASTNCGSDPTYPFENPPVAIHVNCVNSPTVAGSSAGTLALQNDVIFNACLNSVAPCTPANTIISAEVNFQKSGSQVITYVLSWSVNG